ncbi:MAG: extracellular solute-binding protein [Anaerolineae bacterium]
MANRKLSRRDFLRMSGASAAMLASGMQFQSMLRAAPSRQDVTNIVFGGWGATAEDNGVQAAIKQFEIEHPEIAVEWQLTPNAGDYMQQLLTNFAAGTAPDTSFIVSDRYETLRASGQLMDITDRLKADPQLSAPGYFFEPQEENRCADANGRWHGIGSTWVAHHVYYNQELFDKAGITPPGFKEGEIWDWNTFIENAKQLTMDSKGRHPDDAGFDPDDIQQFGVQWPLWWMPIAAAVYSNGGEYVNSDGLLAIDSPEAMEAMQNLADLVYKHHVAPRTATMSDLGMTNTQMLDNGRLAMAVDGSWALSWMNPSMVSVPMGTGAIPMTKTPASLMQAHFHSIISSTQHPDESWEWLKFLASPFYTLSFMKIGLWLPSQSAQVTPDGLKEWVTEGIHPANYVDFVTDYLPKHGVAIRIPNGYIEADTSYITPAFQALEGGTPAEEIFPEAVKQANEIIKAAQAG